MAAAFEKCKQEICLAAELAHPQPDAAIFLSVDASATHVGAALQPGQTPRPLAFFSAKLTAAQQKYSAFDRELRACYLAIRHFRWSLEGRSFYILTDHKPLTFAIHRLSDAWSARQQQQMSYVVEFTSDIRHVAGKNNMVADALSRLAAAIATPSAAVVDFKEMARLQSTCSDTATLARESSLQVQQVSVQGSTLLCDMSGQRIRPLVPAEMRKTVFLEVHGLSHPGIRATKRLISSRFVWRGCASDVAAWSRECLGCARGKTAVHVKSEVMPIEIPANKFQHVHVDIVGPLPTSATGYSYLLTCIDRTSRWPEAIPLSSITAESCADAFVEYWIARFGVPHTVITDRGTQFSSATWVCLAKSLGFRHIMTTSYHPQSNGMVERLHRQIKDSLRARNCGAAWAEHLPWVMLGLRATPKEDSDVSAAEMVYQSQLVLPNQVLLKLPGADDFVQPKEIQLRPRSYAEVVKGPAQQLEEVDYVYVQRGPAS
jgi:hypothetical protein